MLPLLFAATQADANLYQSYVVGWGTLSLINAGLAQSKERSGLFWWLLSLFFGPFATFLLVALVDKPAPERPRVPTETKFRSEPEV